MLLILAWLTHRSELGVTYGAPHLKSLADLMPPENPPAPMDDEKDYSFFLAVDSDMPNKPASDSEACTVP